MRKKQTRERSQSIQAGAKGKLSIIPFDESQLYKTNQVIHFSQKTCKSTHKQVNEKLGSILVFSSLPFLNAAGGEIQMMIDSFYIYNHEDYVLYQIPEVYHYTKTTVDTTGNVIEKKFLGSEIKFNYWVFKTGDSIGLRFNSLDTDTTSRFNIDSLIDSKTSFKQGITLESYQLIEENADPANKSFSEIYIPKIKEGNTSPDTSILYFSNEFNAVNFSFAKDRDLQKKSKLYKFRIIFNPIPKGEYAFDIPRRELLFEIRKPQVEN